ncbi:endonuclease MutS2 [Propionigenium maris DSM 9537]|uniref:Endonuclease MutS2 n=1 Tax=Propionigenium maris DSM 9537 TaxID=1123000 RepID=A0A9W6GKQ0_9FUSO|nr:hypothetical protein [Propionigenium maris]GLI55377.1 endonuclease MutS2 [Propionigenium maris DSM 9537]
MRYLDKEQRKKIGYEYIVEKLQIQSPYGRRKLQNLKPYLKGQEDLLALEHRRIERVRKIVDDRTLYTKVEMLLMRVKDVENTCISCEKGKVLDEVELYELKVQSMVIEEMRGLLSDFEIEGVKFTSQEEITALLDPNRDGLPTYHIYSSYSERLREIRDKKRELEKRIMAGDLDSVEELREQRLEVVVEEGAEELVIRKDLSKKLEPLMEGMLENIAALGRLDLLLAKGRFCNHFNLVSPKINSESKISAKNLINLQIKEMVEGQGQEYTPIDVELSKGTTVITGANMGGKTVALKTITLNVFLFQMGFYPMGEGVSMPLFDFIDFISDDMQDISKGLSTFGAEMMKLKEIMIFLHRGQGFVALDEFARGTNPYEGQKIAKSLGEYLNDFGTISLMATHYDGVVNEDIVHYQVVGLRDVDFEKLKRKIDLNKRGSIGILQKYMDYRLERCEGYEAPKDALNITMLLGIHEDFTHHILKNYKGES